MTDTERIKIKREALKAKRDDLIHFNCEHCEKDVYMRAANVRKKVLLLCNPCQISYTKSLRTEEQKRITHEKTVQTCLERYGTVNGGNSEISKKKARESWARNWGSEEECFKQRSLKSQKTFEEKYNGSYSTPEIIEKKAKTLIAKHGSVENAYKLRSQKAKETNTTMKVFNIKPYIAEALELKGSPNKYSFIESCKAPKRKEKSKVKLLYEKEVELTQKDTIAKSE